MPTTSAAWLIRPIDVLRYQVVAVRPILTDEIIPRNALTLTMSAYDADAADGLAQVVRHKTRYALEPGKVILRPFLDVMTPTVSGQVIVSAVAGLPAFHVITATDVTTAEIPTQADSFALPALVEGHYTLEPISAGTLILRDQISAAGLVDRTVLAQRKLVTLPLKPNTFNPTLLLPATVSLLLSPRDPALGSSIPNAEKEIQNVLLLALTQDTDAITAVCAVYPNDVARIAALLGGSDVFILITPP